MADEEISWRRRGRTATEPKAKIGRAEQTARSSPGGGAAAARLTPAERVRIARRAPQAVLKVMKFRQGRDAVRRSLVYAIGKADWRFHVEGDVEQRGEGSVAALLDEWEQDFSTRKNGRDVVHIELSCPPGYDRDRVHAAARAFADAAFGANNSYALAEHRDTKHPHCHLLVKLKGHDGTTLNPRKADLARWRGLFAEKGREQGLDLDASPRAARGVGTKGVTQSVYQLRRRGQVPSTDIARAEAATRDFAAGRTRRNVFEDAQAARNAAERAAFARDAARLRRAAEAASDPGDRDALRAVADELAAFAKTLPAPRSERQALLEELARNRAARDRSTDLER